MREVRVASVQFETTPDPEVNRIKALRYCEEAAKKGAQAVCLAEYWMTGNPINGDNTRLTKLAEKVPGPTFDAFSRKAKELGVYIIPGTIVEESDDGRYYNTSCIISPSPLCAKRPNEQEEFRKTRL